MQHLPFVCILVTSFLNLKSCRQIQTLYLGPVTCEASFPSVTCSHGVLVWAPQGHILRRGVGYQADHLGGEPRKRMRSGEETRGPVRRGSQGAGPTVGSWCSAHRGPPSSVWHTLQSCPPGVEGAGTCVHQLPINTPPWGRVSWGLTSPILPASPGPGPRIPLWPETATDVSRATR